MEPTMIRIFESGNPIINIDVKGIPSILKTKPVKTKKDPNQ
jgi:hypothetical protein